MLQPDKINSSRQDRPSRAAAGGGVLERRTGESLLSDMKSIKLSETEDEGLELCQQGFSENSISMVMLMIAKNYEWWR